MRRAPSAVPVSLASLTTRDGVRLDGVIAEPPRSRRTALIWVHGLGSVFSSGQPMVRALAARANRAGIGYFKFNTRGHDVVAGRGRRLAGAAFERFTDCLVDVRAVVDFARGRGYRRIVLAGHSTGANKVLYYAARARDRRVAGLALLGPVSDIAGEAARIGARELARRVAIAQRLARRDPRMLVPSPWGFWGARRYVSLYRPGEAEDVFPYYRPGARWTALRAVRVPVAVMIGGADEYLDRPAEARVEAFRANATAARSFASHVVPRALHGFQGHEDTLARALVAWIGRAVS